MQRGSGILSRFVLKSTIHIKQNKPHPQKTKQKAKTKIWTFEKVMATEGVLLKQPIN